MRQIFDKQQRQKKRALTKQKKNKDQSFTQSIRGTFTNIAYKIGSLNITFWKQKEELTQSFILGKQIDSSSQAKAMMRKIIWFSYRKNFQLSNSEYFHSDTGWGCVFRAGQMLLAQALKVYFEFQLGERFNDDSIKNIITAFLDEKGPQEKYSINLMLNAAQEKNKKLKAGSWLNFSQIGQILQKLQNLRPIKGSESLKIKTFNSQVIYLDRVYEYLGINLCQCLKKRIICQVCHRQFISEQTLCKGFFKNKDHSQLVGKKKRHLLIIVVTRLGYENIQQEARDSLMRILENKCSLGAIGGFPKKALYLVGQQNKKLIYYLDPHYTQESPDLKNLNKSLKTFFCEEARKADLQKFDPNIAFAFYIKNLSDLNSLVEMLTKLRQNSRNPYVCFEWKSPQEHNFDKFSIAGDSISMSDSGFQP